VASQVGITPSIGYVKEGRMIEKVMLS